MSITLVPAVGQANFNEESSTVLKSTTLPLLEIEANPVGVAGIKLRLGSKRR